MDAIIKITLQDIIIHAQREKEKLLRGGKGLPEPIETERPDASMIYQDDCPENNAIIPHNNVHSLAELADSPVQININDAISAAEEAERAADNIAASTFIHPASMASSVSNTATSANAGENMPDSYTIANRVKMYFRMLYDWRIERRRKKYEYDAQRKSIEDACTGYDEMIRYVNQKIAEFEDIDKSTQPSDYQSLNRGNI